MKPPAQNVPQVNRPIVDMSVEETQGTLQVNTRASTASRRTQTGFVSCGWDVTCLQAKKDLHELVL